MMSAVFLATGFRGRRLLGRRRTGKQLKRGHPSPHQSGFPRADCHPLKLATQRLLQIHIGIENQARNPGLGSRPPHWDLD